MSKVEVLYLWVKCWLNPPTIKVSPAVATRDGGGVYYINRSKRQVVLLANFIEVEFRQFCLPTLEMR